VKAVTEPVTTQTVLIRKSIEAMRDGGPCTIRYELEYLACHGVPVFDLVSELVDTLNDNIEYVYVYDDEEADA
jgi:hypothetical protein